MTIYTNHNYYEEQPLCESGLMREFGLNNKRELKKLKEALFSNVFILTTKNSHLEQMQLCNFQHKVNKLEQDEQLILKLYSKENAQGERQYIIQTGLFAGVIYHKGYEFNIVSRYGDVFLRRMLNSLNDIYVDTQQVNAMKSTDSNAFQQIIAHLFIQTLEKASFLGLPKVYQSQSLHSHKVRGKVDINAYLKKSIPFSGKLTSTLREQFYVQEIVDVLFFACTILERSFGKEIHQKVLGTLQILKQHYSGNYPTPEIIKKAQSHIALQNPVFSGFSKALEYAEIIIKDQNLIASEQQSHLTTQSYLFDIAQLFEVYLEKLLGRHLPDWSVSDQAALTLYPHQFYKRRMFPDLVLRHKQLGKVMVFDAKFKNMRLEGRDVDRADFYQIHTYIQYYQPDVLFGGLLYPLSKNDVENSTYAGGLFGKAACETGFMVDGVYVDEKMDEHTIISNELQLIERIKQKIHTHLYH